MNDPYSRWRDHKPNVSVTISALAAVFSLSGCGRPGAATHEITQSRPHTKEDAALVAVNSTQARLGFSRSPVEAPSAAPSEGVDNPFRWRAPLSWVEVPGSSFRAVNFKIGASGQGECYLVALPGGAGGLVANVNRWRKQMGQTDLSDEEVLNLPKMQFFGKDATRIDISGSFAGMGATTAQEGYRMLGAIKATEQVTLFVKMIGPSDLVAANIEEFDAFCASLGIKETPRSQ